MKKIGLRLFDKLHEALDQSAEKNHRSLHGEMIHALVEYVRSQGFQIEDKEVPKPRSKRA